MGSLKANSCRGVHEGDTQMRYKIFVDTNIATSLISRYALCTMPSASYLLLWHHSRIPFKERVLRTSVFSSQPRLATATPRLIIHI